MSSKAISLENATALYKDVRDRLYLIKDEYVPQTRTINDLPLTNNIQLDAVRVGAVTRNIKINNKNLASSNINLSASDVGAYTKEEVDALIPTIPTSLPASDVYEWAKASTKPTYTASEVGAAASSHTHTKSQITDFPTSLPASDVYSWAKASSKPSYSASEVGAVPTSRTVNGKALSGNITLSASDVGAAKISYQHNSTSVSSMSVGELKLVGFSSSYDASRSVTLPSGGTYYVVGITESSDYNGDWFASGETGAVKSGGNTVAIYGYHPWLLVYRIS